MKNIMENAINAMTIGAIVISIISIIYAAINGELLYDWVSYVLFYTAFIIGPIVGLYYGIDYLIEAIEDYRKRKG